MYLKFIAKQTTLGHITPDLSLLTHIHINYNNYFKIAVFVNIDMTKLYINKGKVGMTKLYKYCYAVLKKTIKQWFSLSYGWLL